MKEGVENVLISRVQVRDKDSKGTAAWRVKYKIHEDTGNFRISTDPETNDGLLYLEKVFIQCAIINVPFICDLQESNYSASKHISVKFNCTAISYSNPSATWCLQKQFDPKKTETSVVHLVVLSVWPVWI